MTLKAQNFAKAYVELGNATEAAIKAGYTVKSAGTKGYALKTDPTVAAYITELLKDRDSNLVASAEEVLRYLTSVMRGESVAEVVIVEGLGQGKSKASHVMKKPSEQERITAGKLLAKRYNLLQDTTKLEGTVNISFTGEDELTD